MFPVTQPGDLLRDGIGQPEFLTRPASKLSQARVINCIGRAAALLFFCCKTISMTIRLKLNNDWDRISRLLKNRYPVLSETELNFTPGGENMLVERLAAKLKLPAEEIRAILLKLKITAAGEPVEA